MFIASKRPLITSGKGAISGQSDGTGELQFDGKQGSTFQRNRLALFVASDY